MKKIAGIQLDGSAQTILALGGVALVFVLLAENRVKKAVEAAGDAVNPVDKDNIFHSGVNAVGAAVSGKEGWSLGGWVYDVTHPNRGPKY